MRIDLLKEPELQFGYGSHVDIRHGIMNYLPFDILSNLAPHSIKLGIIGTNESIEGINIWLNKLKNEILGKDSKLTTLYPNFIGFNKEIGFKSEFIVESKLSRSISPVQLDKICKNPVKKNIITDSANLFLNEIEYLVQKEKIDVIICAIPKDLVNSLFKVDIDNEENHTKIEDKDEEEEIKIVDNFRRYIKAKSMHYRVPLQLVLPHTYDENIKYDKGIKIKENIQDIATRSWNFCTALYYKANGTPWRLINSPSLSTTCFIGISFYKPLNQKTLQTSLALVFNEKSNGIILRGTKINMSKDDKVPHLNYDEAYHLLLDALDMYRMEHGNLPSRIVIHKSSNFTDIETQGFLHALDDKNIKEYDLLTIFKSSPKLFRTGHYPPLRGTKMTLDNKTHILYTRGSIPFYQTYPGLYIPRSIEIRCFETQQTSIKLCNEILGLTKMNWNNTQFDGSLPITMRASKQVSEILKYVDDDSPVEPRYSFYM